MSDYAPWLILAAIAFVAGVAYLLITEQTRLDGVIQREIEKQDEKEKS